MRPSWIMATSESSMRFVSFVSLVSVVSLCKLVQHQGRYAGNNPGKGL